MHSGSPSQVRSRSLAAAAVAGCLAVALGAPARCVRANDFVTLRNQMVDKEIVAAGIKDPRVIQSMRDTPRHEFVAIASRPNAYFDMAMAIGHKQTISPPFVVAYMTEQLLPQATDKVLEIGTGSGYQAAVLSPLVKDVYTIEIVKPLGERAARTLQRLKYANVHTRVGDGYQGWPEAAPFDKIIVTCSPENVPPKLVEQLREGGRMIVPVGERYQQTLYLFQKQDGKLKKLALLPTLFVPMTGKAEAGRVVLPDPAHPTINNGSFEELTTVEKEAGEKEAVDKPAASGASDDAAQIPIGWHYQTQVKLVESDDAPDGTHYVTFTNAEPGRHANALQGLGIDGTKVHEINVHLWVKVQNVRPGDLPDQQAAIAITFYDENRAQAGFTWVGPWSGTNVWQEVNETLRVPPKAREAIVQIGLRGATGSISFDDIRIRAR